MSTSMQRACRAVWRAGDEQGVVADAAAQPAGHDQRAVAPHVRAVRAAQLVRRQPKLSVSLRIIFGRTLRDFQRILTTFRGLKKS